MKHSDQVVSFIETSINSAKLKEGKRTEYRLKTTRGNVMEHLVLEVASARRACDEAPADLARSL